MRNIALAVILSLCAAAQAATRIARDGKGNELHIMDLPCVHGGTLSRLAQEWRPKFKKAIATNGGHILFGCWVELPDEDGMAWVILEGNAGFAMPLDKFKPAPEA